MNDLVSDADLDAQIEKLEAAGYRLMVSKQQIEQAMMQSDRQLQTLYNLRAERGKKNGKLEEAAEEATA